MAYYLYKMISVKTWYKSHNNKFLAIIKTFKKWWYYLENCKSKVLIFTNHNNLCHFMIIKSLSSRQIWWDQELFCYYFWINYPQKKANEATNALSHFSQRDNEKKTNLWTENIWMLYDLQFSLTNGSISGLHPIVLSFSPQYQILICGTYTLL